MKRVGNQKGAFVRHFHYFRPNILKTNHHGMLVIIYGLPIICERKHIIDLEHP